MADIGMGKLVDHDEVVMDAVHVAVITMRAGQNLHVGEDVGFDDTGDQTYVVGTSQRRFPYTSKPIGIVDPFLKNPVKNGERFWLFLYPNSTTPMRHNWKHPDIGVVTALQPNKAAAEKWLHEFAEEVCIPYANVIRAGHDFNRTGNYFTQYGSQEAQDEMSYGGKRADFWRNWSIVTGEVVNDPDGSVFSCSC